MQNIIFKDLGRIGYQAAWDYQEVLFKEIHDVKVANREKAKGAPIPTKNYLLFCEHPPVFTLGKSGDMANLLLNTQQMKEREIEFVRTNRGGDITYHGPGQIVGYPVLDLDNFFTDIHKYMRFMEESIIRTLAEYGIQGNRMDQYTGVWLDPDDPQNARKICAMGVKCSRWITMHGFAFNVNTDLTYFDYIVPCGIADKAVTSMQKELGKPIDVEAVKQNIKHHFARLFEANLFGPQEMAS